MDDSQAKNVVWGPRKHCYCRGVGKLRQGEEGVRLPGVCVVDELVVCKALGDGVCEVQSMAAINNPDRPASTLEPRSHT